MVMLGIDVSHHQGPIDWPKAATTAQFAWIKATQGSTHTDHLYRQNALGARTAGLPTGAYHFLDTSNPKDQALHFHAVTTRTPVDMVALDVEKDDVRSAHVRGFVTAYRELTGRPLVVYTGKWFWRNSAAGLDGSRIGPLWSAGVLPSAYIHGTGTLTELWRRTGGSATSGTPYGSWNTWDILQYTDKAQIPGIAGPVDGNAFLGTPAMLTALTAQREETEDMLTDAQITEIATRTAEVLLATDANISLGGRTPNDANRVGELLLHTASRVTTIRERVSDIGLDQLAEDIAAAVVRELGLPDGNPVGTAVTKAVKSTLATI